MKKFFVKTFNRHTENDLRKAFPVPVKSVTEQRIFVRMPSKPFWEEKSLEEMNHEEWESLCDGCGKCCLQKLEDEDTGEIHYTALACSLLDVETCRCKDYKQRHKKIPQCIKLNPERIHEFGFLPGTCAYRLLSEGKALPQWHPLRSGSSESVHDQGISVKRFAKHAESGDVLEHHLIDL